MLERDPELRLEGSAINLWSNAFRALRALGVAQPLLDDHPALARHVSTLPWTVFYGILTVDCIPMTSNRGFCESIGKNVTM